jgi:hypothetical protein
MRFFRMKLLVTAFMIMPLMLCAARVVVPSLNSPEFADLEVNKCVPIPDSYYEDLRVFTLEVTFNSAGTSNGFHVAFGNDTGNGFLEFEEISFQIGFDGGRWKLREKGMKNTYICTDDFSTPATRVLSMRITINNEGMPMRVAFKDNNRLFTFPCLDLSSPDVIPDFIKPPFSDMKITRRGYFAENPEDLTTVSFDRDGIKLLLR